MNQKKIDKIFMECYRRMFKEATPSVNDFFNDLVKTGKSKEESFFMKYYLSQDRQDEIIEDVLDEFGVVGNYDRWSLMSGVLLGCSPRGEKSD